MAAQEARGFDDASERAKQHFERGYALAARGDFSAAIEEFEHAQAVSPNVSLLYNLGQAYAAAGRSSEAVTTLERYLKEGAANATPERRRQVETLLRYHSARVGRVALDVTPVGASVAVDGKAIGTAPLAHELALTPGVHVVVVKATGFQPAAPTVEVEAKSSKSLKVVLEPVASTGASLLLECKVPDVEISVDGARVATGSEPVALPVPQGAHVVRFSRPGYVPDEQRITASPRAALSARCALRPDPATVQSRLRVRHPAGSSVVVDGVSFQGQLLPPGVHEIRVSGAAFDDQTRRIVLSPRQVTELTLRPPANSNAVPTDDAGPRRTLRIAAYVAGGLGVVSAVAATALYIDTSSRWRAWDKRGQALRLRESEPSATLLGDVDALLDDENTLRNRDAVALGLGVGGGVLMAGAAALFFASRAPAEHWVVTGFGDLGLAYHRAF